MIGSEIDLRVGDPECLLLPDYYLSSYKMTIKAARDSFFARRILFLTKGKFLTMKLFEANRLIVWTGRVKRTLVRRCLPLLKDLRLMKKGNDLWEVSTDISANHE